MVIIILLLIRIQILVHILINLTTEQFKNEIKDIDDLRRDFIKKYYGNKKFDKVEYQKYIDKFVKTHSTKPLIFVELINMSWWHINYHNYFIELDDETIIKKNVKNYY